MCNVTGFPLRQPQCKWVTEWVLHTCLKMFLAFTTHWNRVLPEEPEQVVTKSTTWIKSYCDVSQIHSGASVSQFNALVFKLCLGFCLYFETLFLNISCGLNQHFTLFNGVTCLFPQVCNLSSGHFYQFRAFAANVVGIGKPSEASDTFLCEKWTMPQPGEEFSLRFLGLEISVNKSLSTPECVWYVGGQLTLNTSMQIEINATKS